MRSSICIFRPSKSSASCSPLPEKTWSDPYILNFDWIPPEQRSVSRRKIAAHALFHGQRHWAQLATLVRNAGFPSDFRGDLLFNPALP